MKKIIPLLAAIALMASGTASAAFALASAKNDFKMTDCNLLANDIDIVLSKNAVGGIQCDTTNNFIALSVCHTSGLTVERSSVVTKDASGAVVCTVSDTEDCVDTVSGSAYPTAGTDNGTVVTLFPGTDCTTANVGTHVDAQTAQ